jgi:putative ABC transport system permease protein
MAATNIGWGGVAASLVLIALALGLSFAQQLKLEREMVWASARAAAQLLLVGVALVVVLDDETPIAVSWAWVVAMVLFAALTVRARASAVPGIFRISLAAMSAITAVSLGVIFGLGIFPVEAEAIVPLAGMMIGNAMGQTVLAANRVVAEIQEKRDEVEARLALGQPAQAASRPYVAEALRTAMISQIERTKAVGVVILPGAMTGLILAGVDPEDAVRVQLAVMYLILGSVATSVTIVGVGVRRRLFTADHRLVRLPGGAG